MAKRPIIAVAGDFASVLALLQERGVAPANPSVEFVRIAKGIHEYTYSLILWRFRLQGLPEHSKVFVEEIASDALQFLPQVIMGYSKPAKVLIRGISENVLRHIYFADHPVEFARMNLEKKWFLSQDQLYDYAKNHPLFVKTEKQFDAVNQLSSLHSDLSGGVHGRTVRDLEMRIALSKIAYDENAARAEADYLRKCAQATNFLLAIFHRDRMRQFGEEDKRIILRTMPERARTIWIDHDP